MTGLRGIPARRGNVVRPLIEERRAPLRAWLDAAGIAYRLDPSNADRVVRLMDRVRLSIITDLAEIAREWSQAMTKAGRTLDVLVKVDVGFHRCGIDPQDDRLVDFARQLSARGHRLVLAARRADRDVS